MVSNLKTPTNGDLIHQEHDSSTILRACTGSYTVEANKAP